MVMQSPSSCAHLPKAVCLPAATKETVSAKWNTYSCTFFFLLPCVPRWALLSPWEQVTAPLAAQCRNTAGDNWPWLRAASASISNSLLHLPNTSSSPQGVELLAVKCQPVLPFSSTRNNQLLTEWLMKILFWAALNGEFGRRLQAFSQHDVCHLKAPSSEYRTKGD